VSQHRFERRLRLLTLTVALPGSLVALALIWSQPLESPSRWFLTAVVLGGDLLAGLTLVHRVVFPLQTLANLLGGLREGDFSSRARGAARDDALGEVLIEANALADTLRGQRLDALEASALLRAVMVELDVAVFAFDDAQRLRLVNRAGESLLRRPQENLLDRTAAELGLGECLEGADARTLTMTFAGGFGRYGLRRSSFRQGGKPHVLVVLTDLSRALREEERLAWQRLLRVLSHELNNSLAPIKSVACSMEDLLAQTPLPEDWLDDTRRGLSVISTRAEALARFMEAYGKLSRLPPPRRQAIDLAPLIRRVATLEGRVPVKLAESPSTIISADPDQLEQLLINLLRNAADAVLELRAGQPGVIPVAAPIVIAWKAGATELQLTVSDAGSGLANPTNIFVPFFTTKVQGSGIGLTLCRQIAEAHGGTLTLENRTNATGCVARLRLPLAAPPSPPV